MLRLRSAILVLAVALCAPGRAAELGATVLRGAEGVRFGVWAPHAQSVSVAGSFNGWDATRHPLSNDDGKWSGVAAGARPGDGYLFVIDGRLWRKDPRGRQVTGGVSVVYDPQAFEWGPLRESSAAMACLVLYQLHPGTFFDPDPHDALPGTLRDAASKLDHLRDLGVSAVLLMPVAEFHGARSWGYNPSDPFAVESSYGGPDALKAFVKAAHARGIAVHLDVVHNHYGPEDLDLERFDGTEIYFYPDGLFARTPWGPRPHFGRREVGDYIADNVRMWFDEYRIDGLRWDSVVNIRAADNVPNAEGERLLDRLSRMVRREYAGKLSIAEDAVGDPRFDASWEYAFHHSPDKTAGVVPQLLKPGGPDLADLAACMGSPLGFRRVIYTENHDETGRLNNNQRLLADFDAKDPHGLRSRRRAALAIAITLTSVGTPLLFMGQELLEHRGFHDDVPLEWGRGRLSSGFVHLTRDLIRLRRNLDGGSPALTGAKLRVLSRSGEALVIRRYRSGRPHEDIAVVFHFGEQRLEGFNARFPQAGEWKLLFDSEHPQYGEGLTGPSAPTVRTDADRRAVLSLAPLSVQIYGMARYEPSAPQPDDWDPEEWIATHTPREAAPPADDPMHEDAPEPAPPPAFKTDRGPFVLVGDFTQPGPWAIEVAAQLVADHVWQFDLRFDRTPGVAFRIVNPATGLAFGGIEATRAPLDGVAIEDAPPAKLAGWLDGDYRVTFNERTQRLRLEPRAATDFQRLNIVGNFNHWNRSADPMTMIGDHRWQATIETNGPVEFIIVADGSLDTQWGGTTHPALPADGTATHLGPPFLIDNPPPKAVIDFNESTGAYSIHPATP